MLRRVWALAQKEFIQVRRDRRTLAMMIAIPLIWLVLFGYAFTFDVDEIAVAVVDQSGTDLGARAARAVREYPRFRLVDLPEPTEEGIRTAFYRNEVQMAVLLPPGFGEPGSEVRLQVWIDGSQLFSAQAAARLLGEALEPLQAEVQAETAARLREGIVEAVRAQTQSWIQALLGRLPPPAKAQLAPLLTDPPSPASGAAPDPAALVPPALTPDLQILYNPDLKSAPVMIPGLLGMVVMFITTLMTAMGVAREREHGTLEQLVVTPIRPLELMLGKILPYFLVGLVDFALVFAAGVYLFDLEFAGNLPLFLGLSLLLVFTTLGLGLLLSTVAQNQQQAMQLAMMVVMPQVLISGMIFPLSALPAWIRYIAYALPFTHYVPIAHGMFIKGQGLDLLGRHAAVLALYAEAMVALASVRFRKRLA
ncbi:MAG: ABC transporter permease [Bacillota bacterium]